LILSLENTLDLYFQLCSTAISPESAAIVAAVFANAGKCPFTERIDKYFGIKGQIDKKNSNFFQKLNENNSKVKLKKVSFECFK
jgi:hypothetical protein